jgi:hypothetical protein
MRVAFEWTRMRLRGLVGVLLLAGLGCSGSSAGTSGDFTPGGTGTAGTTGAGNSSGAGPGGGLSGSAGSGGGTGSVTLPPETELESSYEVPVATGHFIWVANPLSGRVAYVDAASLDVHTAQAGNAPTYMASIPSATDDAVMVLNALSNDATVMRVGSGGLVQPQSAPSIPAGANSIAMSRDGSWAIAWTDARRVTNPSANQGFQDLTFISLANPAAGAPLATFGVSVGFRPVAVAFSADSAHAFAVTQDGISVVDVRAAGGPKQVKNVHVTDDPTENADTRDVSITPDGATAVIRREGSAALDLVDLASGTRTPITLSGPVTDVDLTDDGTQAVAVVRDTAEVAVLPLAAGIPSPDAITHVTVSGEIVGSVVIAPGGGAAVLYSNAAAIDRITVLTLGTTPSYRVVKLHAPVLSAFPTAGAHNAIVLHAVPPSPAAGGPDGGSPDGGASDAGAATPDGGAGPVPANAFSLVPLDQDLPAKIVDTVARPQSVAITDAGDRVLVTVRDDVKQMYGVYMGLFPTLEVQPLMLASPPIAVGVVAGAARGYVAQKHPEGRITFVTLASGDARTLTGFELGAGVVDWSAKP